MTRTRRYQRGGHLAALAMWLGLIAGCAGPIEHGEDAGVDATPACPGSSRWHPTLGRCARCLEDTHCHGDDVCSEGRCVRCVEDADCNGFVPYCVDNGCRRCAGPEHCPAPDASRCGEGYFCQPCVDDGDCAHIAGRGVCDEGVCVECTFGDPSACGDRVCDGRARVCTDRLPRTRGLCDTCVADTDCEESLFCVAPYLERETATAHCYWRFDAPAPGPAGGCFGVRPFVQAGWALSVQGERVRGCFSQVRSSCEALRDHGAACSDPGEPGAPAMSASCGTGAHNDGFCRLTEEGGGECTTRCGAHYHCPCADEDCRRSYACVIYGDDTGGFCSTTVTCTFPELECE